MLNDISSSAPMAAIGDAADDTLGGRISLARDAIGHSAEHMSTLLGVTLETWTSWENDRAEPRANRLDMLARVLQVNVAWLLDGRGDGPHLQHSVNQRYGRPRPCRRCLTERPQDCFCSGYRMPAPKMPASLCRWRAPLRPPSPSSASHTGRRLSSLLGFTVLGLSLLSTIGLLTMVWIGVRALVRLAFGRRGTDGAEILMRQVFGPERCFSIMVPAQWSDDSVDEYFHVSAGRDGRRFPAAHGASPSRDPSRLLPRRAFGASPPCPSSSRWGRNSGSKTDVSAGNMPASGPATGT